MVVHCPPSRFIPAHLGICDYPPPGVPKGHPLVFITNGLSASREGRSHPGGGKFAQDSLLGDHAASYCTSRRAISSDMPSRTRLRNLTRTPHTRSPTRGTAPRPQRALPHPSSHRPRDAPTQPRPTLLIGALEHLGVGNAPSGPVATRGLLRRARGRPAK